MTHPSGTPADRAAAVLRAAEAAEAAGRHGDRPPPAPRADGAGAGAADRLLRAADDLASGVEDARGRLDELQDAVARLAG